MKKAWKITQHAMSLTSNLIFDCWSVVYCYSHCGILYMVRSMFCFALLCVLVLESSWWGRESCLIASLFCFPGVSWLQCGSSSRYHRFVCSSWLWYFLIILTIFEEEWHNNCLLVLSVFDSWIVIRVNRQCLWCIGTRRSLIKLIAFWLIWMTCWQAL